MQSTMWQAIAHNAGRQANAPMLAAGAVIIAVALGAVLWLRASYKGYGRLQRINASGEGFRRVALALGVVYFLAYSYLSVHRYYKLLLGSWDLGIFDSLFHNALHGAFFRDYRGPFDHFQPVLAAFLPLYALWQDARLLLIVQSAVIALAAWPLYLVAREVSGQAAVGAAAAIAYLFYPFLGAGNLYDFHGISLTPLFFFSMLVFMLRRRWGWYWVFLALLALTKESEVILSFGAGLYLISKREYRVGFATVAVSVAWFFLAAKVLLPWTSGAAYRHLVRYEGLIGFAQASLKTREGIVTACAFTTRELALFVFMMLPVGFLALRRWRPALLIFAPYFLVNVFSMTPYQNVFWGHYTLTVTAAVLGATALSLDGLKGFSKDESPSIVPLFLVITATLSNLVFSWPANERFAPTFHLYAKNSLNVLGMPLPVTKERAAFYRQDSHENLFTELAPCFPRGSSIAAQNNLGYFFAVGYELKDLKEDVAADYYLFDLSRVETMHTSPEMLTRLIGRLDREQGIVRVLDLRTKERPDFVFYAKTDKAFELYQNVVSAYRRDQGNPALVFAVHAIERTLGIGKSALPAVEPAGF